jgi:hypothetical protein
VNIGKFIIIICLPFLFSHCGRTGEDKGKPITENRTVDQFEGVRLEGSASVTITKGATQQVSVKGLESQVEKMETSVKNKELIISSKDFNILDKKRVEVNIEVPVLNDVTFTGEGNIVINSFTSSSMKIKLTGAGNIRFSESRCDTLYATLSGARQYAYQCDEISRCHYKWRRQY